MVDDVSMCSMRAHSKQLAELGHCKCTAQVSPPFETVSAGRGSIYVFSESPFKMVAQVYSSSYQCHLQVIARVTFKFTARVTFKFTRSVTFKFTA